jgi:hypothetical protein
MKRIAPAFPAHRVSMCADVPQACYADCPVMHNALAHRQPPCNRWPLLTRFFVRNVSCRPRTQPGVAGSCTCSLPGRRPGQRVIAGESLSVVCELRRTIKRRCLTRTSLREECSNRTLLVESSLLPSSLGSYNHGT